MPAQMARGYEQGAMSTVEQGLKEAYSYLRAHMGWHINRTTDTDMAARCIETESVTAYFTGFLDYQSHYLKVTTISLARGHGVGAVCIRFLYFLLLPVMQ
jgi:hypothetical protein